jgi:Heavy metal associated domain 2
MFHVDIAHDIPGRLRLRASRKKGDVAWFEQTAEAVSDCAGVERVEANPVTGSLLIFHSDENQAILDFAEKKNLFTAKPPPPPPPLSEHLGGDVRRGLAGADHFLRATSRGEINLLSATVVGLTLAAAFQMVRGRTLPAAVQLLAHALDVVGRMEGRGKQAS